MRSLVGLVLALAVVGAACAGSDGDPSSVSTDVAATDVATTGVVTTDVAVTDAESDASPDEQLFPDVVDATARLENVGWTLSATISSPYDTAERYADAWRIVGPDGTVYGVRELAHDHAGEQPFTRSLNSVEIPDDVDIVTIEGRDQANGWGGETFELTLIRT